MVARESRRDIKLSDRFNTFVMVDLDAVPLPKDLEAPDYAFWARAKKWSEEEATLLAVGCDPASVRGLQNRIMHMQHSTNTDEQMFSLRLAQMSVLVDRHFGIPHFHVTIGPTEFVSWLQDMKIWVPPGMAEAVGTFDRPPVDWQSRAVESERRAETSAKRVTDLEAAIADGAINASSATRERDSLLKLVIGMAIGGYGYDPRGMRSPVPAQIATDLQTRGLSLSDDTIRKYLREGAELLPPAEDE